MSISITDFPFRRQYHDLSSRSAVTSHYLKLKMKPIIEPNPNPRAPKITNPCIVCGKEFRSPKALHGHMRKHPERPWRGCKPPSNTQPFSKPYRSQTASRIDPYEISNEDIASCLILLSEGKPKFESTTSDHTGSTSYDVSVENGGGDGCRFKCTSCDKGFVSHQALGGHRASHKNVKGCFAITKSSPTTTTTIATGTTTENTSEEAQTTLFGEKRQIQNKSTNMSSPQTGVEEDGFRGLGLDLNLPAPVELDGDGYYDLSPNSVSSYFRRFF